MTDPMARGSTGDDRQPPIVPAGPGRRGRLRPSRSAKFGIAMLAVIFLLALAGPLILPDPNVQDLTRRLVGPAWTAGGGWDHPLGTDELGRDVLARTAAGARVSLVVSFFAVVISGLVGVAVGVAGGFFGGVTDRIVSWLIDIQLAFPFILLVVLVVGAIGPSLRNVILVLGATGWVLYARVVRAQAATVRQSDYVRAAETVGLRRGRIVMVHVLPNCFSSVVVIASLAVAQMVLFETALSFLGLGVQPPAVSWGMMLSGAREYMTSAPSMAIIPGIAIFLTVLGTSLVGEWLRDALDPRMVEGSPA